MREELFSKTAKNIKRGNKRKAKREKKLQRAKLGSVKRAHHSLGREKKSKKLKTIRDPFVVSVVNRLHQARGTGLAVKTRRNRSITVIHDVEKINHTLRNIFLKITSCTSEEYQSFIVRFFVAEHKFTIMLFFSQKKNLQK